MFAGPSLIAWVFGDSMRYRRAYYAALEDRAARLEAERDAQAQVAAAAERARIARELHDVVAHNVSVMVVQADGASYALGSDAGPGPAGAGRDRQHRAAGADRDAPHARRAAAGTRTAPSRMAPLPASASSASCWTRPGPRGWRSPSPSRGCRSRCRRRGAGRLPDRAGVAHQHPQARRARGHRPGDAAVPARTRCCCGSPTTAGAARPPPTARPRADRHARAGGDLQRLRCRRARARPAVTR